MSIVFQLQVSASCLPNYWFLKTPKCYAYITTDGRHVGSTKIVSGTNPQWDETLDIPLSKLSEIGIQIFYVKSPAGVVSRGIALFSVKDSLLQSNDPIVLTRKLRNGAFVHIKLLRNLSEERSSLPTARVESNTLTEVRKAEIFFEHLTTATTSDLCQSVLEYVKKVVQFGDILSQVHPYAELAWSVLTIAHRVISSQLLRDEMIKKLLLTIHDMLEFVGEVDAFSKINKLQDTVSSMMAEIYECAKFIQKYGEKSLGIRILRDNFSTTTDDRIKEFIATFQRLKENFNQGINLQTFKLVESNETNKLLKGLPGWKLDGVKFNESKACLHGTRQQLLDEICTWVHSSDDKVILWLSGGAGTGKTSVANSIAVLFDTIGHLGACFFFNRDKAEINNPSHVFGNICYQLAHFKENGQFGIRSMVLSAIRSMGHVASSSLRTQARKLIVDTANAVKLVGPVVVIIDGLEESGTLQMRKELVEAIAAEFPRLPQSVKIMITSRDEPDIRMFLEDCSREICIDDVENTPQDIAAYIQHRLVAIQRRSHLRPDWPGCQKFQELVTRAGRLFIWASIACNFVEEKRNPTGRLDLLLDVTASAEAVRGSPLTKLDILYGNILRNAFPDEDDTLADFRYIIGSIVTLETPLKRTSLDFLLDSEDASGHLSILQDGHEISLSSFDEILLPLRSVLKADSTETMGDGPLRLLHPSLYDFLTNRAEGCFRINVLEQHRILAIRCLSVMNSRLVFDVCRIGDPSTLNKEIERLPEKIDDHLPDGLRYACRSMAYHLSKVSDVDTSLKETLKKFLYEHLLHWIEAMSLLGEISKAEFQLNVLAAWLKNQKNFGLHIEALVSDSISLLRNFGHAIRLSALHTYFSALPLIPRTAALSERFSRNFAPVPIITSSHPMWTISSVRVMEGHADAVFHIAFSPDGEKLVSASYDKTVQLWDAKSGQPIGDALKGHTDWVNYAIFSPDGKKLASASNDETVRLWDVKNGKAIGVFRGHANQVHHITFSPDGTKLASASNDATLRIWDVCSGQTIDEALEGHTGWVRHIVFSPDGKRLASASNDKTVRLWDVQSGPDIDDALKGHTDWVNHVAFSPDGKQLASASNDETVQLWNIQRGQIRSQALKGHTGWVRHVVFSPDGKKLVSGSNDKTIRLWDVQSAQAIGKVLEGHLDWVNHVVFSPDGRKLVSASSDKMVRLWDVATCHSIGEPLKGHTGLVRHVVISPDGKRLASASFDKTILLWDLGSAEIAGNAPDSQKAQILSPHCDKVVSKPVEGHTDWVNHVVFSPDRKQVASASSDKTVRLWDIEKCKSIGEAFKGHTAPVNYVVFSPDGKTLASASNDSTVRLWNIQSNQPIGEVLKGHASSICHIVFSPDGKKLALASYDKTVRTWDLENLTATGMPLEGHKNWVIHVVFSPDAKRLASASSDRTVRLWDIESGKAVGGPLVGHTNWVNLVVFSPDGRKLMSASRDKMIRIWDVISMRPIGDVLKGHTGQIFHATFSQDGNRLVSASNDNTVRVWDAESGQCTVLNAHEITNKSWINKVFVTSTGNQSKNECSIGGESVDKLVQATMFIDDVGFLRRGTRRLVWLPSTLRGCIAVQSFMVVIGGYSGSLTFIRFPGSV